MSRLLLAMLPSCALACPVAPARTHARMHPCTHALATCAHSHTCSGGTLGGILPLLAVFYAVMLKNWTRAVDDLAFHYDPSHAHRMSVAGSIDEEVDGSLAAAATTAAQGLPPLAAPGSSGGDDGAAPQRQPAPAY